MLRGERVVSEEQWWSGQQAGTGQCGGWRVGAVLVGWGPGCWAGSQRRSGRLETGKARQAVWSMALWIMSGQVGRQRSLTQGNKRLAQARNTEVKHPMWNTSSPECELPNWYMWRWFGKESAAGVGCVCCRTPWAVCVMAAQETGDWEGKGEKWHVRDTDTQTHTHRETNKKRRQETWGKREVTRN